MKNILHRLQQRPHLSSSVKPHLLHFQFGLWNYSTYFLEERELEIGPNNSEIDILKRGGNGHFNCFPKPLVRQNDQKGLQIVEKTIWIMA